jgi:hypothetical protein
MQDLSQGDTLNVITHRSNQHPQTASLLDSSVSIQKKIQVLEADPTTVYQVKITRATTDTLRCKILQKIKGGDPDELKRIIKKRKDWQTQYENHRQDVRDQLPDRM